MKTSNSFGRLTDSHIFSFFSSIHEWESYAFCQLKIYQGDKRKMHLQLNRCNWIKLLGSEDQGKKGWGQLTDISKNVGIIWIHQKIMVH